MKKIDLNQTIFVTRINDNKDYQRKTLQEVTIEIDSENQEFASITHDNEELCMSLDNLKLFSVMINNAIHLFENYGNKSEKFSRKCSVTGEGMNEGWFIDDEYFSTPELADAKAIECGYTGFDDMYKKRGGDSEKNDSAYYTSWEDQDDYQYQMINGVLQEIEE